VTKIGRRTLFAIADLQAFIEQHRQVQQLQAAPLADPPRSKRGRPSLAEQQTRRRG
jgi:hypothetical protein